MSTPVFTWSSRRDLEHEIRTALQLIDFTEDEIPWPLNRLHKYQRTLTELRSISEVDPDEREPDFKHALAKVLEEEIQAKFDLYSGNALRIWLGLPCTIEDPDNPLPEGAKQGGQGDRILAAKYYGEKGGWVHARYWIDDELMSTLAAALCEDMPSKGRALPGVKELEQSLARVLRDGLPLAPTIDESDLLEFLPIAIPADGDTARIAGMDKFLREQLDVFELDEYAQAARILFARAPGTKGTTLKSRQQKAATVLSRSSEHVRTEIRPKIVAALAWQIYRLKLTEDYL